MIIMIKLTDHLTKQDRIESIQMVLASHEEPCLVSQQRILVASKLTDIAINNKDISTLNVSQHWEVLAIQKHHCLQQQIKLKIIDHTSTIKLDLLWQAIKKYTDRIFFT